MSNVEKRLKSAVVKAVSNNLTIVNSIAFADSSINSFNKLPNYELMRVTYAVPSASVDQLKKSAVFQNDVMKIDLMKRESA